MLLTFLNDSSGRLCGAWVEVYYIRKINPQFVVVNYNLSDLTHPTKLTSHSRER